MRPIAEILALVSKTQPGCLVEVGVGQGETSRLLYKLAQEQNRQLHLFDFNLGINIKALCPQAVLHPGKFPKSWINIGDIAFCFYDIADVEGAKFMIDKMTKGGTIVFYPFNKKAIDYNIYPDWSVGGYPYLVKR